MAVSTPTPTIETPRPPSATRKLTDSVLGSMRRIPAAWVAVSVAVVWSLVSLRAETFAVSYLDDSSVHEQMVRFATLRIQGGHLPLTSWFPYLGLGSPQFLHYQSLPAMLTGLLGTVTGPDAAFRWTLYLLMALWPVSVYLSSRLFGFSRGASAAAAVLAPFVMSVTGVGYEPKAYLWIGYGVWAQLWASVTLPIAWGLSWRAIRDGRNFFAAALMVSLTICLHFETGYLALLPLLFWPFVLGRRLLIKLARGAIIGCGALIASAWVIVPLIDQRTWAATNEVLRGTGLVNGYGAPRVLGWLATGQLLDSGRLPLITVLAAAGLILACARWRRDEGARAIVVALILCLLLSFGRATFGSLANLLPGSSDIFFRRFMMGIQLAALLLAGVGVAWGGQMILKGLKRWGPLERLVARPRSAPRQVIAAALLVAGLVLVLYPAWGQVSSFDRKNAAAVRSQQLADRVQGAEVDRLLGVIARSGPGRVYAGMPSNWGASFTVGAVPVFKYLESRDVDEVGYTLRTASLMTNPEYFFDERNPADYSMFAIRYLILPSGWAPPVAAHLLLRAGPYALWRTESSGYLNVGAVVGTLDADRTDLGARSYPLLRSPLGSEHAYLRVNAAGPGRGRPTLPTVHQVSTGSVSTETDHLVQGKVSATVSMHRPGVAVLSASFDPGWTVTVDGHAQRTEMIAPAVVGVRVPAGVHRIVFRYAGFSDYPLLFAISALALTPALPGRPSSRSPKAKCAQDPLSGGARESYERRP